MQSIKFEIGNWGAALKSKIWGLAKAVDVPSFQSKPRPSENMERILDFLDDEFA